MAKPAAAKPDKIHILIMDDSIGTYLRMAGITPERLLDGTGLNVEVKLEETPEGARYTLEEWARKGIKPDIVTTDVMFGPHGQVAIQELSRIMDDLYKDMPELKPAKIFVHSKSGIEDGDHAYAVARSYMKKLGAEYCHTDELFAVGDKFGSDRSYDPDKRSPTTKSLRNYLKESFGIDMQTLTRDEIEANKNRTAAERVGDNIAPYDAVNAVQEGGITPQVALKRISPDLLAQSLEPALNNQKEGGGRIDYNPITFKNAVGGAATGVMAFTADEVNRYKAEGKKVILVLENFTPADTKLLGKVDGVALLGRGSNHLPVLCKNHGIPGIFAQHGPSMYSAENKVLSIQKDEQGNKLVSAWPEQKDADSRKTYEFTVRSGEPISIETQRYSTFEDTDKQLVNGQLYRQGIPVETPFAPWYVENIMPWARAESGQEWHRKGNHYCHGLMVKSNADTPEQAENAFKFGAQGIGLLRTEHMLMQEDRLHDLQTYMLAEDTGIKAQALEKLKASQKADFTAIYEQVKTAEKKNQEKETAPFNMPNLLPLPVTMRLLDAKPEELLPSPDDDKEVKRLIASTNLSEAEVKTKLTTLIKANERGVQFGVKHKDLYQMQAEALFEAARDADTNAQGPHKITPEIMIPLVKTPEELSAIKEVVDEAAKKAGYMFGDKRSYRFGTMIETKEAVMNAAALAKQSDFFSFGTNDLTEAVTGLPRNDIEAVDTWMNQHRAANPFRTLEGSVRAHMQMAAVEGLRANKLLKINACGDQVSCDQPSIQFCQSLNLDAVSVPANLQAQITTSVIAGQEALKSHEEAKAESMARRAAGIKSLAEKDDRPRAASPEAIATRREEQGKQRER